MIDDPTKPQSGPADDEQLLLPDRQPAPAPKPSSPVGTTLTIHIAPEHAEVAHHALAVAADKVGPMIGELLALATPAAPKKPSGSHPHAQALAAGIMLGLGDKYQGQAFTAAGARLKAQALSAPVPTAVAAKPPRSPRKPRAARPKGKRGR
jgi:hypothetical protein